MKSAIQVCALKKSYDGHMVLKGLNLQIEKGEILPCSVLTEQERPLRLNAWKA